MSRPQLHVRKDGAAKLTFGMLMFAVMTTLIGISSDCYSKEWVSGLIRSAAAG